MRLAVCSARSPTVAAGTGDFFNLRHIEHLTGGTGSGCARRGLRARRRSSRSTGAVAASFGCAALHFYFVVHVLAQLGSIAAELVLIP